MPRNEWFAALFIVGCVNGLGEQVIETIGSSGWVDAALGTFGTSAIVWVAIYAGIGLVLEERSEQLRAADIVVGSCLLVAFALPIGGVSWLAISILSLYAILVSVPSSARFRGATILLAATIPMFWIHLAFRYFGDEILRGDAALVGLLLGTGCTGNVVPFVHGAGSLIVLPYCSSFSNVWLAFLGWLLIFQWRPRRWSIQDLQYCLVAAASVISVNVTRLGLMALGQRHYDAIHGQWGDLATNLLILGTTFGICLLGVQRETDPRV